MYSTHLLCYMYNIFNRCYICKSKIKTENYSTVFYCHLRTFKKNISRCYLPGLWGHSLWGVASSDSTKAAQGEVSSPKDTSCSGHHICWVAEAICKKKKKIVELLYSSVFCIFSNWKLKFILDIVKFISQVFF